MVVAPYVSSYVTRVPYLTNDEFAAAPLGFDLSNLVPSGTAPQESTVLTELIRRASARVDTYCMGSDGTLCASLNTESKRIRADRQGNWLVNTEFWPIIEVVSFSVGSTIGDLQAVPLTTDNIWIEKQSFEVTQGGLASVTNLGPLQFGGGVPGQECFCQYTYSNGWINSTLSAAIAAGSPSIAPVSVVGIQPGMPLTVYDPAGGGDEDVVVSSTYVAGAATVTLAANTQFAHAKGVNVTSLPATVKEATIHFVASLIKERGSGGFTMSSKGGVSKNEGGGGNDRDRHLADAMDLLDTFMRVV